MNPNNYTQKSLEAIQSAQDIALAHNNQQIEQVHLLQALLQSQNGLIPQLLKRMGVSPENLEAVAAQEIRKLPQVTGGGREAGKYYIGRPVDNAFREAEQAAERMKDDFVSVEHLFIGLLRSPDATLKLLFSRQGITEEAVLQALQGVRGTQRVTRSAMSSASSPARPRTIPALSASPASARPPSSRAWPSASSRATCPRACRTRPSSPWTWAR